ncbi:MAG: hypothetical protein C5B47_08230 [Verrucomicrobia bacterium]|nr:MAG: hypothetical protein C5B47_08230 [Verrucomicrobiota bacterium]
MLPEIEKLLVLQDSDQRIRTLQLELLAIPQQRAAKEKTFSELSQQLSQIKFRLREIELEKKRLELDAEAKRESIARYKQQQLQTRKNEEYSALNHEISIAEEKIRSIEDRELELMETIEKLRPLVEQAEKAHVEGRIKLETQLSGLETRKNSLEARIRELQAGRARLTEGVEEDLLDRYTRLFKSKAGQAVVPVEHEVCSGCHMKVTTQTVILVKSEKSITHCPQCGRVLYLCP